jgi:tRNA A-37 threonylcarbamoyl transferase component Bud32
MRVTTQAHIFSIYFVANSGLEQVLTKLPEFFLDQDCKIVKLEKKVSVVRVPLRIGRRITPVYIKQHNAVSFRHRLASVFCASAALRSLSGAATLLQQGYATARPLAAVEYRRWSVLLKSFYVSEEILGAKTIRDYWREDLVSIDGVEGYLKRRAVLAALESLFRSLHESGIYHNDLKASNILALDGAPTAVTKFRLIDLQGLRKCIYLSKRRRIKNLAQINRTLGNDLSRTEKLFFVEAYAGRQRLAGRKKRRLVRSILKETRRQLIRERARHPATEDERFSALAQATRARGRTNAAAGSGVEPSETLVLQRTLWTQPFEI